MRLISIGTVNFKKLGTFFTEFKDGLNVISAENFKGKSTLLQAIEFAFFGASAVPGKKELIPTHGQTTFSVELKFAMHEGDVFYALTRNKTTAKVIRHTSGMEPEIVANGNTPATAYIEQLFGLAAKDYNLFVQSRQGESSGILTFGAAALNRKVEEFAGVDMIDKVQGEAQRRATSYSGKADAKGVSEETMTEAVAAWESAKSDVAQSEDAVKAAKDALAAHPAFSLEKPKPASELRTAVQFAAELANKLENAERALVVAKEREAETKTRFEKLAIVCVDSLQVDLDSLNTQGQTLKVELKALEDQDGDYTRASNKAGELRAVVDTTFADYIPDEDSARLDAAEADRNAKQEARTKASELVGTTKAAYDNLKSLATGAKCPTCNRAKEDHDPVKLEEEAAAAKAAWESAQAASKTLDSEIQALHTEIQRLVDALHSYNTAATAARTAEEGLAKLTPVDKKVLEQKAAAYEEVRGAWSAANQKMKDAATNNATYREEEKLFEQRKQEVQTAACLVANLDQQWADLPEPPTAEEVQAAEQAEAAYTAASEKWKVDNTALTNTLNMATNSHGLIEKLLITAKNKVAEYNKKNEEARDDLVLSQRYNRLVQFLRTRRQQYMKDVWDTIMAVSSKLVRVSSKGTITALTNEDGEFNFVEEGISAPTASASGAQKAFIGTAIKVGLGRALYGSDSLLIFDEPTESCSEQYAGSMAAMIASSARQVLLITHRENDQSLADHVINIE